MKNADILYFPHGNAGFTLKRGLVTVLLIVLLLAIAITLLQKMTHHNQANVLVAETIVNVEVAADNNMPQRTCTKENTCTTVTYDKQGNKISVTCTIDEEGQCVGGVFPTIYDPQGHVIAIRECEKTASDGTCSVYGDGTGYVDWNENSADYKYDEKGNKISSRYCKTVSRDGSCASYGKDGHFDYTYDEKGNMLAKLYCNTLAEDGTCRAYGTNATDDNCYHLSEYYTYDENGNRISMRTCRTVANDGTCSIYDFVEGIDERSCGMQADFTYDTNGKRISARYCGTVANDGTCQAYSESEEYEYDAAGNNIARRECYSNVTDGTCQKYTWRWEYTYDNGVQKDKRTCSTQKNTLNPTTGQCIE